MKKRIWIFALAAVLVPGFALAATPKTFADLANQVVLLLGSATTDLIVLAIVIYFWGVSTSLFKGGEEAHSQLRKQLLWGIVVIFLAVSIWGVVRLLQSSLFGSNTGGTSSTSGNLQNCTGLNCKLGQ